MKLKCDEALSSVIFDFKVRRYIKVLEQFTVACGAGEALRSFMTTTHDTEVSKMGWAFTCCKFPHDNGEGIQVGSIITQVESAPSVCNQRSKLTYDGSISKFLSISTCTATQRACRVPRGPVFRHLAQSGDGRGERHEVGEPDDVPRWGGAGCTQSKPLLKPTDVSA